MSTNKSRDKESYQDENTRTVIIQKNKQTGIHGKYIVNFDTENLTFSSDNVEDYETYKNKKHKVIEIDDKVNNDILGDLDMGLPLF
ncbi:hypothetical protein LS73_002870 [Helicobacter muridarum]|uniref:Uncharacterized protein n=1 Tax=Helicobacter muridarum TaxID=216 RepID=A0A099TX11_9HELI|nr:hypothetical protein [Helicobacter muridarum]TLE00860.1 hypothetical protein LS73_002870 [Helicobacter muridarum]STQ86631.1 Uncharacterised protein [Helicobacter muridarum]